MVHGQRRGGWFKTGKGRERHLGAVVSWYVDVVEHLRSLPEERIDFHDHMVLVQQ